MSVYSSILMMPVSEIYIHIRIDVKFPLASSWNSSIVSQGSRVRSRFGVIYSQPSSREGLPYLEGPPARPGHQIPRRNAGSNWMGLLFTSTEGSKWQ